MKKRLLAGLLLSFLSHGILRAAEAAISPAFAFPEVQAGAGARAIGLASTYVGIAEGSSALLWNPAGLTSLQSVELALHHMSGLVDSKQEVVVLGLPLGYGNGLGLSFNYEDNGSFEGRDSSGASTGNYSSRAYGASLGWGVKAADELSLGLALKANRQDLAGMVQDAVAADAGLLWQFAPAISLGVAYSNFGPDVAGQQLAQGLRLGLASTLNKGGDYQWLLAVSGEAITRGDQSIQVGLEHCLYRVLSLRAGYAWNITHPQDMDGLLGWSFGGGVALQAFHVDYAILPLGALGKTQRVSLSYAFGASQAETGTAAMTDPQEQRVLLSDSDFRSTGSDEVLSADAKARLDRAIAALGDGGAHKLVVNGQTALVETPYDDQRREELKAIGQRRSALVHDYLAMRKPRGDLIVVVSPVPESVPVGVFQVVLR